MTNLVYVLPSREPE